MKYLTYLWKSAIFVPQMSNIFVKNFFIKVLKSANKNKFSVKIEILRKNLLKNNNFITINELGAGSRINKSNKRKISEIAKYSLSSKKKCNYLTKIVEYTNSKKILELGTSFGISTLYMFFANSKPDIITIEGAEEIANIAKDNFNEITADIELIVGDFDTVLEKLFTENSKFDFFYIDGNHTKNATLRYFEKLKSLAEKKSVFVFDDIRWSDEMNQAWKTIIGFDFRGFVFETLKTGVVIFDDSIDNKIIYNFLRLY